jgi:predicted lipid-binding transport protein (Tim44 family)
MGGDGPNFFDIILFAALAAFLVFRLRNVLGRRTGHEKRRLDPFSPSAPDERQRKEEGGEVVQLPERALQGEADESPGEAVRATLAHGLRVIAAADRTFDEVSFLVGARSAFGWVLEAFAKGDTESLHPLLSNSVYEDFAAAIAARERADQTLETDLVAIKSTDLLEAQLEGRTAFITVKFVSEQVNVTRDRTGKVVEGEPNRVVEVTDIWTFARNVRSRDPNWILVATRSSQ